jgi:GMP reductase
MYSHGYENVCLIPKKGIAKSRSKDCDASVKFGKYRFSTPVMPANMECCIDFKTAKLVDSLENFYIMHRFDDTAEFIERANAENFRVVSISIGVQREDFELITRIYLEALKQNPRWRVDYITIDIAHGHSVMAQDLMKYINNMYDGGRILRPFIIVGNICTADAVYDLKKWGADAAKIGIAQGAACTTYTHTGFGIPMFEAVLNCGSRTCGHRLPIIADGGAKNNGDFVKALVGGATMCMSGGMFAACIDSPAEGIGNPSAGFPIIYKKYFGSASSRSKSKRGEKKHIEGQEIVVPCNGMTYTELYNEIKGDIQSGISYGGGKDLSCLTEVEFKYRG